MSAHKPRILHFIESEGVYGAERVILNLSAQLKINATYIPVVGCIVPHTDSHSALYDAATQLGIEAVKMLDFKGKQEYLKLMETFGEQEPDPEQMHAFFQSSVPDFDQKMKNVLVDFSKDFLKSIKKE